MLIAADGITMTEGMKIVSQRPNPSSVFALEIVCNMAVILLMVILMTKNEFGRTSMVHDERTRDGAGGKKQLTTARFSNILLGVAMVTVTRKSCVARGLTIASLHKRYWNLGRAPN